MERNITAISRVIALIVFMGHVVIYVCSFLSIPGPVRLSNMLDLPLDIPYTPKYTQPMLIRTFK